MWTQKTAIAHESTCLVVRTLRDFASATEKCPCVIALHMEGNQLLAQPGFMLVFVLWPGKIWLKPSVQLHNIRRLIQIWAWKLSFVDFSLSKISLGALMKSLAYQKFFLPSWWCFGRHGQHLWSLRENHRPKGFTYCWGLKMSNIEKKSNRAKITTVTDQPPDSTLIYCIWCKCCFLCKVLPHLIQSS